MYLTGNKCLIRSVLEMGGACGSCTVVGYSQKHAKIGLYSKKKSSAESNNILCGYVSIQYGNWFSGTQETWNRSS